MSYVRVWLRPDGRAAVSSAFSEQPSRSLVEGSWKNNGNRIAMTLEDGKTMTLRTGLAVCMLALSGCAFGPGVECHGTQWYRLGLEDGMRDAKGEAERLAASCGADFNRAPYEEGFRDGLARRPKPPM